MSTKQSCRRFLLSLQIMAITENWGNVVYLKLLLTKEHFLNQIIEAGIIYLGFVFLPLDSPKKHKGPVHLLPKQFGMLG